MSAIVDDTFAEAFPMTATRLVITAYDDALAETAVREFCGNASSVIGCDLEAAMERRLSPMETPDGRPGISVLCFAFSRKALEQAVANRVGQNILTCPTTACYSGLESDKSIKLGATLRFFGDGHQIAKKLGERRYWRVPVMDGEFVIDDVAGTCKGIGGGNVIVTGQCQASLLAAVRKAVRSLDNFPDVILPFPGGVVRSGSKVGSKYPKLRASTNEAWCPTLRENGATSSALQEHEKAALEIVIDGLSEQAVAEAMHRCIQELQKAPAVLRISAGNYGGKLGPFHFHLRNLCS